MTQFDEGKGYEGMRKYKKQNQKVLNENDISDISTMHLPTKVTLVIDFMNQSFGMMFQL